MALRYVALGDSSTEGLDDPYDDGRGWRGWADRFAEHLAVTHPNLEYANLAVRGRLVRQVLDEQLPVALALQPDVATVFAGVNDALRPGFDLAGVVADLEHLMGALTATGCQVLTITTPDPSAVMPIARRLVPRIAAYNAGVRLAAERTGAVVADVAAHPVGRDRRLWSPDRLHANSLGHERIAAGLAAAAGLPGSDDGWTLALPEHARRPAATVLREEAVWLRRHFAPWVLRRLRGRSSGDGVQPKRPVPRPL